jgi:CO dehydrogenase maturation factor
MLFSSSWSQTAELIKGLAQDIGITDLYLIGNGVRDEKDTRFIQEHSPDLPILGFLPYSPEAIEADMEGVAVFEAAPELVRQTQLIAAELDNLMGNAQ